MLQSSETAAASAGTERAVAGVSRGRARWRSDALSWDLTLHLLGGQERAPAWAQSEVTAERR